MKRILTIQDISCVGKCSLTAALPIISAMGVECGILPTAVLSTHTAFEGFTFCDLTDEIKNIKNHWLRENIDFDAIYTGYLGSMKQIALVSEIFDDFKNNDNLIIIDPVMGDNGKLYPGFSNDFPKEMLKLCSKADIILPNITEACFMLGKEYIEKGYDENYIKDMLRELCTYGAKISVITGVSFNDGKLGVMSYNSETNKFFSYYNDKIKARYHGTGDVFASCMTGALARGLSVENSLKLAADYTARAIQATINDKNGNWYGVNFEQEIPYLLDCIAKIL